MIYRRLKSQRQEKRLAEKHKGRVQPGSGSGKYNKGDVSCPKYLIEAKRTDRTQYIFKLATFEKVESEAIRAHREPLLAIEIQGKRFYILSEELFDTLSAKEEK